MLPSRKNLTPSRRSCRRPARPLAQKKQALARAEPAYQVQKTAAELSDYIRLGQRASGKTLTLTALGILVGFGLGDLLHDYILAVVLPDEVMFSPTLGWNAFVIPVIVIVGLTAILGALINRRRKRVDMLEALKSVD